MLAIYDNVAYSPVYLFFSVIQLTPTRLFYWRSWLAFCGLTFAADSTHDALPLHCSVVLSFSLPGFLLNINTCSRVKNPFFMHTIYFLYGIIQKSYNYRLSLFCLTRCLFPPDPHFSWVWLVWLVLPVGPLLGPPPSSSVPYPDGWRHSLLCALGRPPPHVPFLQLRPVKIR